MAERRKQAAKLAQPSGLIPKEWLVGPVCAVLLFLLFLCIAAAAMCRTDMLRPFLGNITTVLGAAACFLGGFVGAKQTGSMGLIKGATSGGVLFLLLVILSFIQNSFTGTALLILRFMLWVCFGAAGGYIGILCAEKRRRRRPN
ncbi:MAG: TIGR04086 family membrane protein [Pygmaiobacter massiliensis]|nr:TIGR04086 family membrane protein [Pygmaiobacter massiliensis]